MSAASSVTPLSVTFVPVRLSVKSFFSGPMSRIPLSETRNYVQRVIENLAVYRARFAEGAKVASKTDQSVVLQETNAALLNLP